MKEVLLRLCHLARERDAWGERGADEWLAESLSRRHARARAAPLPPKRVSGGGGGASRERSAAMGPWPLLTRPSRKTGCVASAVSLLYLQFLICVGVAAAGDKRLRARCLLAGCGTQQRGKDSAGYYRPWSRPQTWALPARRRRGRRQLRSERAVERRAARRHEDARDHRA